MNDELNKLTPVLENTTSTVKPGYLTTEFWLTAAAAILGLLFASGIIPTDSGIERVMGSLATALSVMGYSVSRAVAKKAVPMVLCMLGAAMLLNGCANFSTTQTDITRGVNGEPVREITTEARARTFWASDSALAKFKAAQTDKSQTASVGSLSQSSDVVNSNLAPTIQAVAEGVAKGLINGMKP